MDDYLKILLSGLLGSVIGSLATWFVTSSSIKKQHENQLKLLEEQEMKSEVTALKSICTEIVYNLTIYESVKKEIIVRKVEILEFKVGGLNYGLKNSKWDKHSDTLERVLSVEQVGIITVFYLNLSTDTINQTFTIDRVEKLIEMGRTARQTLEGFIPAPK